MSMGGNHRLLDDNHITNSTFDTGAQTILGAACGSSGYGHKIVEKIVKDHRGMIDYFEEGDMFGVQIILPGSSK